jgi:hypothetical protein
MILENQLVGLPQERVPISGEQVQLVQEIDWKAEDS